MKNDIEPNVEEMGVMTRSASGSDPSPSCAQPGPTPLVFQPSCVARHDASPDPAPTHASVCLHALTRECTAPEGLCTSLAYVPYSGSSI